MNDTLTTPRLRPPRRQPALRASEPSLRILPIVFAIADLILLTGGFFVDSLNLPGRGNVALVQSHTFLALVITFLAMVNLMYKPFTWFTRGMSALLCGGLLGYVAFLVWRTNQVVDIYVVEHFSANVYGETYWRAHHQVALEWGWYLMTGAAVVAAVAALQNHFRDDWKMH